MKTKITVRALHLAMVSASVAALSVAAAPVRAQGQAVSFDIPAQALSSALGEFSRQSNVMVVVSPELTEGKRAPTIKGNMAPNEAIGRLLRGSGLRAVPNPRGGYRIEGSVSVAQAKQTASSMGRDAIAGGNGDAEHGAPELTDADIVVTAQRRSERLREVPISVSVLTGETLDQSTSRGVIETLSRVPGVIASSASFGGGNQIQVRGVGASNAVFSGSSPIGYYIDSIPFGLIKSALAPDSNAYDLERVEVLRGPQGTLHGASSAGGLVRILTKDPLLKRFEVKSRLSLSGTEGGGTNYGGDVAINVPIVEDVIAVRAVVGYKDESGWIENLNRRNTNDNKEQTYRFKISAAPSANLHLGASVWLSRSDRGAPSQAARGGIFRGVQPQPQSTDYDAYGFQAEYDLGAFTVASMTSYLKYNGYSGFDLVPLGLDVVSDTKFDTSIFSQEIVANSAANRSFKWTVGAFYRAGEDRLRQALPVGTAPFLDYVDNSKSFALFGEVGQNLFDGKLEWTLGARYFHDRVYDKDIGLVPPASYFRKDSFDAISPRAILSWHPNSNATIYASYSEGFRSGFPQNSPVGLQYPDFPSLKPDTIHNYEVGAKADLFGGRSASKALSILSSGTTFSKRSICQSQDRASISPAC